MLKIYGELITHAKPNRSERWLWIHPWTWVWILTRYMSHVLNSTVFPPHPDTIHGACTRSVRAPMPSDQQSLSTQSPRSFRIMVWCQGVHDARCPSVVVESAMEECGSGANSTTLPRGAIASPMVN